MTIVPSTRWFLLSLLTAGIVGCAPAQPNVTFSEGVIFRTCAPHDGPAFSVVIPMPSTNRVAVIRVNESLGTKSIVRPVSNIGSMGGADVRVCEVLPPDPQNPSMPKVNDSTCEAAIFGWVHVSSLDGDLATGGLDVKFKNDTSWIGDFKARLHKPGKPQVCG
jgi:hypothetical protein